MPIAASSSTRTVFRACVVNAVRGGEALMEKLLKAATAALTQVPSSTSSVQQRSLAADALRLLTQHEAALVKAYPMALLEIFAEGPAKSGAGMVSETGIDFGELSLMDEAEVHDHVELSRVHQMAVHAADAALTELNTLVSSAQGLRSVQPERNPLRPENYVRALQQVIAEAGVSPQVRQLWMQHMREVLGALLVDEYQKACKSLRERGIEPVGYAVLGMPPSGATRSGRSAPQFNGGYGAGHAGSGGQSMSGLAGEYVTQGGYGQSMAVAAAGLADSLQVGMPLEAEEALLTVGILRQLLAGGGDPFAVDSRSHTAGGAQPVVSVPRAGLAGTGASLSAHENGHLPLGSAEAIEDMAQLERLVGRLAGQPAAVLSGWHRATPVPVVYAVPYVPALDNQAYSPSAAVAVVGRMMDNIAQDGRLLAPVQRALRNLEPAIKQLVQHDGGFFTNEAHPARQLLDELTQRSLAFDAESAPGFSRFMRLLNETVGHLAAMDIQDEGPFDAALKALQAAWNAQDRKARSQQEAEEKVLQQVEQRRTLAQKIAADIRRLPDLEHVPADILDFVAGPWADVVALAQFPQHEGLNDAESDPGGYLALVPLLLWSAQPELTRAEPDRLTKAIPGILTTVRAGLKSIQYPRTQASAFLQRLMGLYQGAFKEPVRLAAASQADPEPELHIVKPANEPPTVEVSETELPGSELATPMEDGLHADFLVGVWVELISNRRAVRTQLTWASPHGTLFLFTAADGSTQSMTRRMRDKLASEGALRVVTDTPSVTARTSDVRG